MKTPLVKGINDRAAAARQNLETEGRAAADKAEAAVLSLEALHNRVLSLEDTVKSLEQIVKDMSSSPKKGDDTQTQARPSLEPSSKDDSDREAS